MATEVPNKKQEIKDNLQHHCSENLNIAVAKEMYL